MSDFYDEVARDEYVNCAAEAAAFLILRSPLYREDSDATLDQFSRMVDERCRAREQVAA